MGQLMSGMWESARGIMACLICLAVIGPILIIVGIVLVVSPNHRQENVDMYNAAMVKYDAATVGLSSWLGFIDVGGSSYTMNVLTEMTKSNVIGNLEAINDVEVTYGQASSVSPSGSVLENVNFNFSPGPQFSRSVAITKAVQSTIYCSAESCSSYCSSSTDRQCSSSKLLQTCRNHYGIDATFTSTNTNCEDDEKCGYCNYNGYLSTYCAVVGKVGSGWGEDVAKKTCYYPFGLSTGKYTYLVSTPFSVQVRSSDDPYLTLEEVTEGDLDFGLTRAQQTGIGLAMVVIGGLITFAVCGGIYYVANRNKQNQPVANTTAYPQGQQQGYDQPQPAYQYNQQYPQAYGQPQPAYGQQQPAYGQQQPAYGQQQPAPYGQPQPAPYQQQPMYGAGKEQPVMV